MAVGPADDDDGGAWGGYGRAGGGSFPDSYHGSGSLPGALSHGSAGGWSFPSQLPRVGGAGASGWGGAAAGAAADNSIIGVPLQRGDSGSSEATNLANGWHHEGAYPWGQAVGGSARHGGSERGASPWFQDEEPRKPAYGGGGGGCGSGIRERSLDLGVARTSGGIPASNGWSSTAASHRASRVAVHDRGVELRSGFFGNGGTDDFADEPALPPAPRGISGERVVHFSGVSGLPVSRSGSRGVSVRTPDAPTVVSSTSFRSSSNTPQVRTVQAEYISPVHAEPLRVQPAASHALQPYKALATGAPAPILISPAPSTAASNLSSRHLMLAEHYVGSYPPLPVQTTRLITYPNGAMVNIQELSACFTPAAALYAPHRARILPAIESGELVRQTMRIYTACDRDRNGTLSWNNGEIRNFIATVFAQHGLTPPSEQQTMMLFQRFDTDHNGVLDARECLFMVDALFRSIFFLEQPGGLIMAAAGSPAVIAAPSPLPSPARFNPYAAGMVLQAPPTHSSAATTIPVSEARPLPSASRLDSSYLSGRRIPLHPPVEDLDYVRPPPAPAAKPPAYQDVERRPHTLEIELDEMELHPEAPDLTPAWHEWLRYFVSFHPRSEVESNIPLPRDAPTRTLDGRYAVSQVQAARKAGLKLASIWHKGADSDSKESKRDIVEFKEALVLNMTHLDVHLVAYVWASKRSMANEDIALVGRALAPLRDYGLQRKSTTWGIFDVMENHRVAEMRVKYSVCTTPSSVQQPSLCDVKTTEVTVQWCPPDNDHGAPILGYKISILVDRKTAEGPEWHVLCERTKSTNPVYVVTNLTGNTAYLLNIQGINKAGAGDPTEFQITTAPVEPTPPPKPWIAEARDGCLNIAWSPSTDDGGTPIMAYKVKMRKIKGATRWNPFGPGEAKAIWVDMGTVGAAMIDKSDPEPATYDAWVGPLEEAACEYRFQIIAMTRTGLSQPSEFSEAYYA